MLRQGYYLCFTDKETEAQSTQNQSPSILLSNAPGSVLRSWNTMVGKTDRVLTSDCFQPSRRETDNNLYETECEQNTPPPNMPLWHNCFELNTPEKQTAGKALSPPSLPKSRAWISHYEGNPFPLLYREGQKDWITGKDSRLISSKMVLWVKWHNKTYWILISH